MVQPPVSTEPNAALFTEEIDDHVANQATDFARWIEYLLNPQTHDGPRIYKCPNCHQPREVNQKLPPGQFICGCTPGGAYTRDCELRSVLDGIDPARFFYALHALCGIWHAAPGGIGEAFRGLTTPALLDPKSKPGDKKVDLPKEDRKSVV